MVDELLTTKNLETLAGRLNLPIKVLRLMLTELKPDFNTLTTKAQLVIDSRARLLELVGSIEDVKLGDWNAEVIKKVTATHANTLNEYHMLVTDNSDPEKPQIYSVEFYNQSSPDQHTVNGFYVRRHTTPSNYEQFDNVLQDEKWEEVPNNDELARVAIAVGLYLTAPRYISAESQNHQILFDRIPNQG